MSGPARPVAALSSLRNRIAPTTSAARRTLPVQEALTPLLPAGLPRGTTVTTSGDAARSFAFALTVAAGQAGSWCAVLGLDGPGWRAAAELGVATDRAVHVDLTGPTVRPADAVAAALDGFDLVLVGSRVRLGGEVERRLAARARERGAVLIGVHDTGWDTPHRRGDGPFATLADLRATTRSEGWEGLGAGTGRLAGRRVAVVVEGRRLPGRRRRASLWLPGPDGAVTPVVAAVPGTVPVAAGTPVPIPARPSDDPRSRVERSA